MATPFLGEIRMFAGNFAPRGFAKCDGQLVNTGDNEALFSVLGSVYGGDGRTTFGLPDLRGRVPIHQGSGLGLTPRSIGQKAGVESVALTANQMPSHTHTARAAATGAVGTPVDNVWGTDPGGNSAAFHNDHDGTIMSSMAIASAGGSVAHPNLMPTLTLCYIIALTGLFPSRT